MYYSKCVDDPPTSWNTVTREGLQSIKFARLLYLMHYEMIKKWKYRVQERARVQRAQRLVYIYFIFIVAYKYKSVCVWVRCAPGGPHSILNRVLSPLVNAYMCPKYAPMYHKTTHNNP